MFWLYYVGVLQIKTTMKQSQQKHPYPRVEKQIEVLVQQCLVLLVPHAELLQE